MASAYSPLSSRFASAEPFNRRVVSDTLALHPTEPKGRKASPDGARVWRQPTRHFRADSHPSGDRTGEWSPTHSRSTGTSTAGRPARTGVAIGNVAGGGLPALVNLLHTDVISPSGIGFTLALIGARAGALLELGAALLSSSGRKKKVRFRRNPSPPTA